MKDLNSNQLIINKVNLMPLFRKKPKIAGPVPIREIQSLRSSGLSDKDIIKRLKDKGYDYREIEKAMLQSLKREVTPTPKPEPKTPQQENMFEQFYEPVGEAPSFEDIYGERRKPQISERSLEELIPPVPEEEQVSPELSIEELVEGVINEKWEALEHALNEMRSEQENIRKEIMEVKALSSAPGEKTENPFIDKINELEERLNNLEPKVSGLEKAFKQFLPSLTDNIRNLSEIIRELREKREEKEEHKRFEFKPSI